MNRPDHTSGPTQPCPAFLTAQPPRPARGAGQSRPTAQAPLDLPALLRELCSSRLPRLAARLRGSHPALLMQLSVHPRLPRGTRTALCEALMEVSAGFDDELQSQWRETLRLQLDELQRTPPDAADPHLTQRFGRRLLLALQQLARQGDTRSAAYLSTHLELVHAARPPRRDPQVRGRQRVA